MLPKHSLAVKYKQPLLAISVLDRNLELSTDRVIGSVQHRLLGADVPSGKAADVQLQGDESQAPFNMDFRWEISETVSPSATLRVSEISARGMPGPDGRKSARQLSDPFLRFRLCDVGVTNLRYESEIQTEG